MKGNRTAFVTGATGFLGSALVKRLLSLEWKVVALVRSTSNCSWLEDLSVDLVEGDVCDSDSLKHSINGCDVVFHCAALTGIGHASEQIEKVTLAGTRNVLSAAIEAAAKNFVFVSSAAVYGVRDSQAIYTESAPLANDSIDPYIKAKIEAERLCLAANADGKISTRIIRPGFIYGPGDREGGFVPEITGLLRRKVFRLVNKGEHMIPLVYIDDLIELIALAATADAAQGQIYNASSDGSPTWFQFSSEICKHYNYPLPKSVNIKLLYGFASFVEWLAKMGAIKSLPMSKASVSMMGLPLKFPSAKAENELGYASKATFEAHMKITLESTQV